MSNYTEYEIMQARELAEIVAERNVYRHRYNTMNSIVKHLHAERVSLCEQLAKIGYIIVDGEIVQK